MSISKTYSSPNFFSDNRAIRFICLHGTAGGLWGSIQQLTTAGTDASSNYIIDVDGTVYCLVDPYAGKRAWANGFTDFDPVTDEVVYDKSKEVLNWCHNQGVNPNRVSVSIEHVASASAMSEGMPAPAAQRVASQTLVAQLCKDFGVVAGPQTILRHKDVAPLNRPYCPGVVRPEDYYGGVVPVGTVGGNKVVKWEANPYDLAVGPGMLAQLAILQDAAQTGEVYYISEDSPARKISLLSTWGSRLLVATEEDDKTWTIAVYSKD